MKKLLKKNKISFLIILILLLAGVYCARGLFTHYGFYSHDGDHHISRSFDAIVSLKEGHFPLRWAGSLNHYCGVPIFNFFYPLIYYLVFLINFFAKDVIFSLKLIYTSTFVLSPIFFYFWLLKETRKYFPSFIGAILYLFVPYRFLLIFVRSSPEFMSYLILPFLLYLISLLFEQKLEGRKIWLKGALTAFTGGLLVISHNFAAMILLPIVFLFILVKLIALKDLNKRKIFFLFSIFLSFFGLAAFFIGPVFLEQANVKLSTVSTINYKEHFPIFWQLVRSPWGYYYSSPGIENDGMSFMLGYAQWVIIFLAISFLGITFKKSKNYRKWILENLMILFWFFLSLISIFLILPYSMFVWEKLALLQRIQFSWRLLGVTSFTIAALAGFILAQVKRKSLFLGLGFILVFLGLFGNRNHLLSQPVLNIDWYYDYETKHPHRYSTTTFADDILNKESVGSCSFEETPISIGSEAAINLETIKKLEEPHGQMDNESFNEQVGVIYDLRGGGEFEYQIKRGNTFGKIILESSEEVKTDLKLNLEFFPMAYKVLVNGNLARVDNCLGRTCLKNIELEKGENIIEWKIVQTPIQKFFNYLSLFFLIFWFGLILIGDKFFYNKEK